MQQKKYISFFSAQIKVSSKSRRTGNYPFSCAGKVYFCARNMRIAVNTRLLLKGKLEGIGWFTYHTLKRMVLAHPEHEFLFFFDRPYDEEFVFARNVTPVVISPQCRHPFLFYIWFELRIPYFLKKYKADIFLSTDGQMSVKTKVPTCLVIHDLAFEHFPEHLSFWQSAYWRHYSPLFARKAYSLVTVSGFTKNDIVKRYGIAPDKITVSCNGAHEAMHPLGYEEREQVKAAYTQGCEYFLFAGALHPRKNVIRLLKAFVAFKRHNKSNMKLVIAGRMAWKFEELIEMKETMAFKDDVVWTDYLNIEELSRVTAAAYSIVYVSLFEGFGIPILEGLKCNVPAIVGNTSSMPEVGGPACLLADPMDPEDIAAQMSKMYKDETLRDSLISKAAAQLEKYNWDKAAELLWRGLKIDD